MIACDQYTSEPEYWDGVDRRVGDAPSTLRMLDSDPLLQSVAVRGELSNYKVYPSGHHYFTLKDPESALRCVMFRGNASRLHFKPASGMLTFLPIEQIDEMDKWEGSKLNEAKDRKSVV